MVWARPWRAWPKSTPPRAWPCSTAPSLITPTCSLKRISATAKPPTRFGSSGRALPPAGWPSSASNGRLLSTFTSSCWTGCPLCASSSAHASSERTNNGRWKRNEQGNRTAEADRSQRRIGDSLNARAGCGYLSLHCYLSMDFGLEQSGACSVDEARAWAKASENEKDIGESG